MRFVVYAVLGSSLLFSSPGFAAAKAPSALATAPGPAHIKAVQDLLGVMHLENELRSVAARSRYPSEAQRRAVFARIDQTPPAEVYQRLAPPLARVISLDTALEMTRFYSTPHGKQVIHKKYNSSGQVMFPGVSAAVPQWEKNERKRTAYLLASKELEAAQPMVQHEAFKLLQAMSREKK